MKILYVLDRPELCGGVKVVFQHAHLLSGLGHEVTVAGRGRRPSWSSWRGAYVDLDRRHRQLPRQGLVIATFWTTLAIAEQLNLGPVVHFCQGYEGAAPHLEDQVTAIEQAYSVDVPTFVVSPHLGRLVEERFGRSWMLTCPALDPHFRPHRRTAPRRRPRVAVHGIFECDLKGVRTALETVRHLRDGGLDCRLIRFSLLKLSTKEREILAPDRFHRRITPSAVARKIRQCDLLLFPSFEAEGFGLPLLEAMASGVPVVASDIEAARFVAGGAVEFASPGKPGEFAAAAQQILQDPKRWLAARDQGLAAARRFSPPAIANQLDSAVTWASQGPHAR